MSEDFMYVNPKCLKDIQVFQNSVKQDKFTQCLWVNVQSLAALSVSEQIYQSPADHTLSLRLGSWNHSRSFLPTTMGLERKVL